MSETIISQIERLREAPRQALALAQEKIRQGYETVIGSQSVITEFRKAKDAAISLPVDAAGGALEATAKLLTLHPLKATVAAARTLKGAAENMGQLVLSPIPTGIAALSSVLGGASAAVQAPFKGGVRGIRTVGNGMVKLYKWLDAPPATAANATASIHQANPSSASAASVETADSVTSEAPAGPLEFRKVEEVRKAAA